MRDLALIGGPQTTSLITPEDVGEALGNVIAVRNRMANEPQNAVIENCEQSLKNAATLIGALWQQVQNEKHGRGGEEPALTARVRRLTKQLTA